MKSIEGGVTAARGFLAAGLHSGIKAASGAKDLGLVLSEGPAAAAGVFTQNRAAAAPVALCRATLARKSRATAVIVNSGNANACTGEQGRNDAATMAKLTADRFDLVAEDVLVLSTGVIGIPLPMDRIAAGIARIQPVEDGGSDFAQAIMTTDTRQKTVALEAQIAGTTIRMGGAAKGSGMIHPNMATLLAVVTTDVRVPPTYLQAALARAADRSFNMISVDGDTSTNDSLILLANGNAGGDLLDQDHPDAKTFEEMLTHVCSTLAREIVRDGEGARSIIEVRVTGAASAADARAVARSITASSLVKSAVFGGDPNWGRVLCAAGYSGAALDVSRATLYLEDTCLFRGGLGLPYERAHASALLKEPEVRFRLELNLGEGEATAWGCDLSYDYVRINAEYTS